MRIGERRQAARVMIDRPCRLRRRGAARFEQAHTVDVSTRGALIDLMSGSPVIRGEGVSVAVAWDGAPVVTGTSFVPARVVRVDRAGPRMQRVAVEFAPMAAAVARAA